MAVGVGPATEFLKDSGIDIQKGGGVIVDECMRVKGVNNVFAIGKWLFPFDWFAFFLKFENRCRRYCYIHGAYYRRASAY